MATLRTITKNVSEIQCVCVCACVCVCVCVCVHLYE